MPVRPSERFHARPRSARCGSALLVLGLLAAGAAGAQSQWALMVDQDLSPGVGAENLLSLYDITGRLEDQVLPPRLFQESNFFLRSVGIGYRLGKTLFIDEFPVYFADVPQHEFFGHAFRAREFDYTNIGFHFSPPYPFGDGSAYTSFYFPGTQLPSPDQDLAMSIAGVEAEGVMARRLRLGWMRSGSIDYHGAYLYFASTLAISNYTAATPADDTDQGNDMVSYATTLNIKEGHPLASDYRLKVGRIGNQSEISFLDPFLAYSLWTLLATYVWSGNTDYTLHGIPVGWGWHYLPALGYRLTPFGGEYLADNLAWDGNRSVSLELRLGQEVFHRFWGVNAEVDELLAWHGCSLDATLDLWKQPVLRLSPGEPATALTLPPSRLGLGGSVDLRSAPLSDEWPVRLAAGFGYKAAGFVPGERLDAGVMWRLGAVYSR